MDIMNFCQDGKLFNISVTFLLFRILKEEMQFVQGVAANFSSLVF